MIKKPDNGNIDEATLTERIVEALRGLQFGSVEITVHDGRVVQLDRRERVRIERTPRKE